MGPCSDIKINEIVKKWIRNSAGLNSKQTVHIVLQTVSCIILLSCLAAEHWLSGENGHQGLWKYCYRNGTADCCAWLDDVIGYKQFIGATRAFLIIESILYLVIFYTIYKAVYDTDPKPLLSTVFTGLIGFCTFLSITIYGARHGDVSGGLGLNVSYIVCAINLGIQMVIFLIGLTFL